MTEPCYGCRHLKYDGPANVAGVRRMAGGTAIPLREEDARNGPGRYGCRLFGRTIARGDKTPKELEPGCKERK